MENESKDTPSEVKSNAKKREKTFDFSKTQKVALKVAYIGVKYQGYARQDHSDNTIEAKLIDALKKGKLIEKLEDTDYTRAGRTDKGVSAFGNVIALKLRAAADGAPPYDYTRIMNGCLPQDIRILGHTNVAETFNARYDCVRREYRYFFLKGYMDIAKMRSACSRYIGEHNFQNFAKIDVTNTTNFVRTIYEMEIVSAESVVKTRDPRNEPYFVRIVGNSFLWHQVRCMVNILFLIASGFEEESVIDRLLDVKSIPTRPNYELAAEENLILFECSYPGLKFDIAEDQRAKLYEHLRAMQIEKMMESLALSSLVGVVLGDERHKEERKDDEGDVLSKIIALDQENFLRRKHKPVLERPTAMSAEENIGKLKGKKLAVFEAKQARRAEVNAGKSLEGGEALDSD